MTARLHPTPLRLSYLAAAEAGELPLLLSHAQAELATAGWIRAVLADGVVQRWEPTPYGRAVAAVRVLVAEDGRHIVAETGDPDEPRVLGDATKMPAAAWLLHVGRVYASTKTKHEAREELRHMAALLLAADTPTTVQEGHR